MLIARRPRIRAGSRLGPRASLGASLIEVLVSIVIASVGLLALAGINAASVRYSKLSQYRATATLLASDITERIRANLSASTAADYAFVSTDFAGQSGAPSQPAAACDATTDTCSAAQIAQVDLWRWRSAVRDSLPGGAVFMQPDPVTPNTFDLWLAWRDAGVQDADEQVKAGGARECPNDLSVSSDPTVRCLYFRLKL